jgi:hypothetical protein
MSFTANPTGNGYAVAAPTLACNTVREAHVVSHMIDLDSEQRVEWNSRLYTLSCKSILWPSGMGKSLKPSNFPAPREGRALVYAYDCVYTGPSWFGGDADSDLLGVSTVLAAVVWRLLARYALCDCNLQSGRRHTPQIVELVAAFCSRGLIWIGLRT